MKYQTKKKRREKEKSIPSLNPDFSKKCLVHLIFSTFGFWYFGHFSCTIFFQVFSILPILPCKISTKIA